jgi:hypothetical protein
MGHPAAKAASSYAYRHLMETPANLSPATGVATLKLLAREMPGWENGKMSEGASNELELMGTEGRL